MNKPCLVLDLTGDGAKALMEAKRQRKVVAMSVIVREYWNNNYNVL
jgi:hypothetical protein